MDRELTLRIVLEKPTSGVDFGLQKGHGSNYETVQTQRSVGKDLRFECSVRVSSAKDGLPNFLGPFAQGPAGQKFIYVDIGTCAGQTETCWSRRLKIPLYGISWEAIDAAKRLETRVAGSVKMGVRHARR